MKSIQLPKPLMKVNLMTAGLALALIGVNLPALAEVGAVVGIPTSTNAWEAARLHVMEKDTNSIYANANDLYLKSIQPGFPEILTISDFIGKDDYYFYPKEQADKFRADDASVIASGSFFETIEENQPLGGVLNYVYVSKTPLLNPTNQICGLRIKFYDIPKPNQTEIPAPTNAWERSQLFIIDKNTESIFLNANENFIDSVQGNFPEIQSEMNLIGRDDFFFYSSEDAVKFQADDKQVMTTDTGYTAVEENQQQGGELKYIYVSKFPLKNAEGEIFGIRVTFFELPKLEISEEFGGKISLTWPEVHSVYDLQESTDLIGDWTRVVTEPVLAEGVYTVTVASSEQRFFRLKKK